MTSTQRNPIPPLRSSCADGVTTPGTVMARRRQANLCRPVVGDRRGRVLRNGLPVPESLWAWANSREISLQPSSYRPQPKTEDEIRELLARVK